MKFGGILVSLLTVAGTCRSAVIEQKSNPVLKLSFNKWHGPTYEESSLERRSLKVRDGSGGKEVNAKIENQQNFYSVDLFIGSPGQNMTVLLDTGSSDLWVTAKSNPYCRSNAKRDYSEEAENKEDGIQSVLSMLTASGGASGTNPFAGGGGPTGTYGGISQSASSTPSGTASMSGIGFGAASAAKPEPTMDCSQYGTFDTKMSKTFKSNNTEFYISYGDNSFASGFWGTDHINLANLDVSDVSFAVANETNSSVGVLGLGLPGDEATSTPDPSLRGFHSYEYQNFPQVLKSKGAINSAAYSLYLNSLNATQGNILFGAVDRSKYKGQLYTLPLLNPNPDKYNNPIEFDITLQGVGFLNGSSKSTFTTTQIPALLDSGTTLMYLPETLADSIAHELGGSYNEEIGYYLISCPPSDDDSKLVYDFGGFNIETSLKNYLLGSAGDGDDGQCVLGILPSGTEAILGDVFLADTYVVYDLDSYEVSLAQASFDDSKDDIHTISKSIPGAKKAPGYSKTWSQRAPITSGGDIFTTASGNKGNKKRNQGATATGSSSSSTRSTSAAQVSSQDMANGFSPSVLLLLNTFILSFLI